MEPIAVDCLFTEDGSVRVRRIKRHDTWIPVTQGRQWQNDAGRHVLIMLYGREVREIFLNAHSLVWELKPAQASDTTVV